MVAFAFRMGAGFPGDVNRTHPQSTEACLIDASAPPDAYGIPVVVDPTTQGVRPFTVGDEAVTLARGFTVRPYPQQQSSATNYGAAAFGAATPPVTGAIDVMRMGYMMVQLPQDATCVKGGRVFVWCAASVGVHVQGGVEVAADAGNTAALDARYQFNGPPDASGVAEISVDF